MNRKILKVVSIMLLMVVSGLQMSLRAQRDHTPKGSSDFLITVKNDRQTATNIYKFDIYVKDMDATEPFEMAGFQFGAKVNPAIYNGGTITITLEQDGSPQLSNPAQYPSSISFVQTYNLIRIAPRPSVGSGNGSILATTGDGTYICTVVMTNSVDYTENSTADLTILASTVTGSSNYPTKISQYIGGNPVVLAVTPGSNALFSGTNIVLNPAANATAYNVTGSGSYCQGGTGLEVGLDGSETGVTYTLNKDGVAQTPTVAGTGSAISFGMQTAGTYTVDGTNASGTTSMTGSAVITETTPLSVSVTAAPDQNNVCQGTSVTFTATPTNGGTPAYQWYVNSTTAGTDQSTYTYVPSNGDHVYVKMTSSLTCVSGNPATSNTTTMVVNTPVPVSVTISAAPGTSVNTGTSVTYTATPANGGTPVYQWYVNSTTAGTNQNTYTYVPSNGDQVYVEMTSSLTCVSGNPATSNTLTMTVTLPSPATSTWTGSGNDHSWNNPTNWDNGVPGSTTEVTIPGGLGTNYPTLVSSVSCASITIEDGGSFIGSEYLSLTTGTALVKRNIVNAAFHFISSPVSTTTFGSVFPLNQQQVWVRAYDEPSGDWVNQLIGNAMIAGKGYTVQMTTPQTALFEGSLNAGPMISTLSRQNPSGDPGRVGWNLMGNPYTSAIDWDLTDHSQTDGSVYVWDGVQYVAWNGTVGGLSEGIIPPQNAFFVKTPANGNTLTIPLSSRLHDATGYYKSASAVDQMITLTAEGNTYTDQMFVHFNPQATAGFDEQYDAYKLFGEETAPQVYCIAGNQSLNINELPFTNDNKTIPVGFRCSQSGMYTLKAAGMESFGTDVPITIEDLKMNTLQDLRENPEYSFSYTPGDPDYRFNLNFDKYVGMKQRNQNGLKVYSIHRTLVVENPGNDYGQVWIYDMTGRKLMQADLDGESRLNLNLDVTTGSYLVVVSTDRGVLNQKVLME